MSQHSFAESATITHLSYCAVISVKDNLSDCLTEIEFHVAPSSPLKHAQSKMELVLHIHLQRHIFTMRLISCMTTTLG